MDQPLIPEAVLRAFMHHVSHCSWCAAENPEQVWTDTSS